jgi:hypothetical protein
MLLSLPSIFLPSGQKQVKGKSSGVKLGIPIACLRVASKCEKLGTRNPDCKPPSRFKQMKFALGIPIAFPPSGFKNKQLTIVEKQTIKCGKMRINQASEVCISVTIVKYTQV